MSTAAAAAASPSVASPTLTSVTESQGTGGGSGAQRLYKVLVIGDYAVGKSSLIKRYTEGLFTPNYKLTIGVDFAIKNLTRSDSGVDSPITLQLWDIAGHERFGSMTRVYYRYGVAAVVVYDIQRPATFDAVLKWKEDLDSKVELPNGEHIPCVLLANKADLVPGGAPDDRTLGGALDPGALDRFVEDHGFVGWFPTSALSDTNVEKAMNFLVDRILEVSKRCNKDVSLGQQGSAVQGSAAPDPSLSLSSPLPKSRNPSGSSSSSGSGCCS